MPSLLLGGDLHVPQSAALAFKELPFSSQRRQARCTVQAKLHPATGYFSLAYEIKMQLMVLLYVNSTVIFVLKFRDHWMLILLLYSVLHYVRRTTNRKGTWVLCRFHRVQRFKTSRSCHGGSRAPMFLGNGEMQTCQPVSLSPPEEIRHVNLALLNVLSGELSPLKTLSPSCQLPQRHPSLLSCFHQVAFPTLPCALERVDSGL